MSSVIDVTVAAVVERRGRFLIVEEQVAGRHVFNQPAGHVEPGEAIIEAVIRETMEETGYRFAPEFLVGIYSWQSAVSGASFLRIGISGNASDPPADPDLDEGIIATHWLSRDELQSSGRTLRSPMVLRTIDDYLADARYSLDCLTHLIDSRTERAAAAAATGA